MGSGRARTVFGATLGLHAHRDDAERQVHAEGLAALAERWTLVDGTSGEEQIVCIQESRPTGVNLALGYYSMPRVPTLAVTSEDLSGGAVDPASVLSELAVQTRRRLGRGSS